MIAVPFTMTEELRKQFLVRRIFPGEYWDYEEAYAWEYPAENFKDSFNCSYTIWRDTADDEISSVIVCIEGTTLIKLDMKDGLNLITGKRGLND